MTVTPIGRSEVERLIREENAQVVEILPPDAFVSLHLPGAINIPLEELDGNRVADLKRSAPVIVYCFDHQ